MLYKVLQLCMWFCIVLVTFQNVTAQREKECEEKMKVFNCAYCDLKYLLCTQCQKGYFGANCTKRCINCSDWGCEQKTGWCLDCIEGLYGDDCSIPCPVNCAAIPGEKVPRCDRKSGHCRHGCKSKWCSVRCEQPCPPNCLAGTCNHINCTCLDGCTEGFKGAYCDCKTSTDGTWCFLIGLSFCVPVVICLWNGFWEWINSLRKIYQRLKKIRTREEDVRRASSKNNYERGPGKLWLFVLVPVAVVIAAVWYPVGSYLCFGRHQ